MSSHIDYLPEGNFYNAKQRGWKGAGWYFWDENNGEYCYGPYLTIQEAESALQQYAESIYDNFK